MAAGGLVAGGGTGQQAVDVQTLERRGHKADCGKHAGAAADPVEHGEAGQPALPRGGAIQLRTGHGDGHGTLGEVQLLAAKRLGQQQHAVMRLWGAAALGGYDAERFVKPAGRFRERAGNAVGICVVDKINR